MTMSTVVCGVVPVNRSRRRADTQLGYRLDVVASDVADVVRSAGGWLYDRMAAGWQVNVLLPATPDARALQILGVQTLDLNSASSTSPDSAALAVSAAALAADTRIHDQVHEALDHRVTEVTLWGDYRASAVRRELTAVQHPLSAAARAFKRQALIAVGIGCGSEGLTETFLVARARA